MALTDLFSNIADAIREKDGTTAEITASDFPDRIRAIPTDIGGIRLESISITAPPLKTNYYAGETFDPTGMVVYANYSNGQSMYVSHSNLTFEPSGALSSDTTSVTVNFQWGIKMASASQAISVVTVMCFGVVWDYSNPSPELTRLTPETDPNGYVTATVTTEPSPAVGTGPGSSPFDSYSPWNRMTLNNLIRYPNGSWGTIGKTNADFSYNNETVVFIPGFWYDVIDDPVSSKRYWYVADKAYKQMERHPGSGKYLARYKCGTEARSMTGLDAMTNFSIDDALSTISQKNGNFSLATAQVWSAVRILYLIEFATWDSQRVIGGGIYGASVTVYSSNGLTDTMVYHTGKVSDDEWAQIQYRGIEGPWGNRIDVSDGIRIRNGVVTIVDNGVESNFIYTYSDSVPLNKVVTKLLYFEEYKWLFLPMAVYDTTEQNVYITDSMNITVISNSNVVYFLSHGFFYSIYHYGGLFSSYGAASGNSNNYGYRYIYNPST